jgi:hypothetical protein
LAEFTEPLAPGAADIRGLWIGVEGRHVGHVEWVEQFGSRTVVTSSGIIHDYGPNSTLGENTDDTEGVVLFTIGDREYCPRTSASMIWNDGILDFHVFGWGPVVVRRYGPPLDVNDGAPEGAHPEVGGTPKSSGTPGGIRTP